MHFGSAEFAVPCGILAHRTHRPCYIVFACVCLHNSDLKHLLVDAIMAIGTEVGFVLVLSQLGHSSQVTRFAGLCIEDQTLSQQPESTSDKSAFKFPYKSMRQRERKAHNLHAGRSSKWRRWGGIHLSNSNHPPKTDSFSNFPSLPLFPYPLLAVTSMLQWNFPFPLLSFPFLQTSATRFSG